MREVNAKTYTCKGDFSIAEQERPQDVLRSARFSVALFLQGDFFIRRKKNGINIKNEKKIYALSMNCAELYYINS